MKPLQQRAGLEAYPTHTTRRSVLKAAALAAGSAALAGAETWEGTPSTVLANDRLKITVLLRGASVASINLTSDTSDPGLLWNPVRMSREAGRESPPTGAAGHFICVDGFGPVSAEERAAGLSNHGEAHLQDFRPETRKTGGVAELTLRTALPILCENFSRTYRVVDGEQVVYVESTLENQLGFDRPVQWAEHATVGSPYLEPGVTVFDVSGSRAQTRPYQQAGGGNGGNARRLQSGHDFEWPMAPGLNGETFDMRTTPTKLGVLDHTATLIEPSREFGWTTALHPGRNLLLGYLFRRVEYPWLQTWGNYPVNGKLARGMEFSTQPYDLPRQETDKLGHMFGAPVFRWLPAKSKIQTHFLFFYTAVPAGFTRISDVRLESKKLVIEDRVAKLQHTIAASLDLPGQK
jgi:hypothetical protein